MSMNFCGLLAKLNVDSTLFATTLQNWDAPALVMCQSCVIYFKFPFFLSEIAKAVNLGYNDKRKPTEKATEIEREWLLREARANKP